MIRSIPVSVSIARIFRPSLPMILPFISSFGKFTTDTVVSATWSAAQRCRASDKIFFAFLSASSLARFSASLSIMAVSCVTSFSTRSKIICLAWSDV